MLDTIGIRNFKSLRNCNLGLSKLSLLTGLNGSGKSSFIQALLLLRQSYNIAIMEKQGLILNGSIINLGKGKDIFYQYAENDEKIEFEILYNSNTYLWQFGYKNDLNILEALQTPNNYSDINLFNKNFQYLNTEHISPKTLHEKNEVQVEQWNNIGNKGEYAIHYLSKYGLEKKVKKNLIHPKGKSNNLIHQTDAWLNEISPGVKLSVKEIKDIDYVKLGVQFEDMQGYSEEYQPVNVGFGITYVLPVILAVLKADQNDILIIENPESHLHPRGQSQMGSLIAYAAQSGVQIILETHSDHIINGIRVAVKEQKIEKESVRIFFFERVVDEKDVRTITHKILIDKTGELSNYPKGFLDEWDEQLSKLI